MTEAATYRQPLTERQQLVYEYIWLFRERRGYCCTIREIVEHFGFEGTNSAMCHIHALRRKGWVTWEDGQARTLRPVEVANV